MAWRWPNQITLPGGFRVPIKYRTNGNIRRMAKDDKSLSKNDLLGFWDGQAIYINSSQPEDVQIKTLGHEIVHAAHDYALWLEQTYADPLKQARGKEALNAIIEGE